MIVPFVKVETELVNGYMASRESIARRPNLKVLNKDNEEIDLRDASANDTFRYTKQHYRDPMLGNHQDYETVRGFFLDETPFDATMVVVGSEPYGKGSIILHELDTDRFHIMYPSHLIKVLKQGHIFNGAFNGAFQYTRKGSVFCVKFLR